MRAVNLIPADQRGDAGGGGGRSGGGVYVVLGLFGGLAVMALLYGLAARETSSRRSDVASLTAEAQQAQARAAQLAPYTSFLAMREQRVQAVSQLVDSRFDWAHIFHELGRVLPQNKISLTSLDGTVGSSSGSAATPAAATSSGAGASTTAAGGSSGSSVTSATPPGSIPTFTLTGCATSQAEVALMLDRLRLIEGVKEVALQSSTQSSTKSSSSAGGSGSGGCAGGEPAFTAQVVFDALPNVTNSVSSSSGSATTVAASAGGSTTAPPTGVTR